MSTVRLDGDVKQLIKRLNRLSDFDMTGVSLTLAEALRTSTRERFKSERAPSGKRWRQSLRARAEGGTTLTDNADLKGSIKSKATMTGFAVGTNKLYAATHQYGDRRTIRTKTARGLVFKYGGRWVRKNKVVVTIPARPFLGVSDADMAEIKGTLADALRKD